MPEKIFVEKVELKNEFFVDKKETDSCAAEEKFPLLYGPWPPEIPTVNIKETDIRKSKLHFGLFKNSSANSQKTERLRKRLRQSNFLHFAKAKQSFKNLVSKSSIVKTRDANFLCNIFEAKSFSLIASYSQTKDENFQISLQPKTSFDCAC